MHNILVHVVRYICYVFVYKVCRVHNTFVQPKLYYAKVRQ